MLCREIFLFFYDLRKNLNALFGQNVEMLNAIQVVHIVTSDL